MRNTRKKENRARRQQAFDTLAVSIRIFFWHFNIDVNRGVSIIFNNVMFRDYKIKAIIRPIHIGKFQLGLIE